MTDDQLALHETPEIDQYCLIFHEKTCTVLRKGTVINQ